MKALKVGLALLACLGLVAFLYGSIKLSRLEEPPPAEVQLEGLPGVTGRVVPDSAARDAVRARVLAFLGCSGAVLLGGIAGYVLVSWREKRKRAWSDSRGQSLTPVTPTSSQPGEVPPGPAGTGGGPRVPPG